jgi:hypothetical protein
MCRRRPETPLATRLPTDTDAVLSDGRDRYLGVQTWRVAEPDGPERGAVETIVEIRGQNFGLTMLLQPRRDEPGFVLAIKAHVLDSASSPPVFATEIGDPILIKGRSSVTLPLSAAPKPDSKDFYERSIAATDIGRSFEALAAATTILIPVGKTESGLWTISLQLDGSARERLMLSQP